MVRKELKIIYHHHSGFSIEANDTLLVFDYWRGEAQDQPMVEQLMPDYLQRFARVYAFVSHSHMDHLDPVIFDWAGRLRHVEYVLGNDIEPREGIPDQHVMSAGDTLSLDGGFTVTAYPSTDLGVSFHVLWNGLSIFHAGDLNLWHWRDESTVAEINQAEDDFNAAMRQIGNLPIDVCMFPVDPRQGEFYSLGAERFIMNTRPALFIPMHWFKNDYIITEFARTLNDPFTQVLTPTRSGTTLNIAFEWQDGDTVPRISVETVEPPKRPQQQAPIFVTGDSPFADTDLPVELH